ncbi:hypothetical protein MHU86_2228 [Fragilaria crotonensis]|nr:hypothetical protein MHU86_2228 [Fragilaria crotonensis]
MERRIEAPDMTMTSTAMILNNNNHDDQPTTKSLRITKPALLLSMSASLSYQRYPRHETESKFDGPSRNVRLKRRYDSHHAGVDQDVSLSTMELPLYFRPIISYNCLIIPVFFGIWWFWFRRKATSVFQTLLIQDQRHNDTARRRTTSHGHDRSTARSSTAIPIPHGPGGGSSNSWDWEHVSWSKDEHDQFSTWEQVMDQNYNDPSIRLVRWVKTRDADTSQTPQASNSSTRKRRMESTTIRNDRGATMTMTSSLEMPIMDTEGTVVEEGNTHQDYDEPTRDLFVSQVLSSDDSPGQWQCLDDAGSRYGFDSC